MEKSCKKKLVYMFFFTWNSTITSKAKKSTFDLKITFGEHFGGCSVRKSIFLQNMLIFNFWSKLCDFKTWCTFFRIIALCKFLCLSGLLTTLYILGNNNFKFKNILFGKSWLFLYFVWAYYNDFSWEILLLLITLNLEKFFNFCVKLKIYLSKIKHFFRYRLGL